MLKEQSSSEPLDEWIFRLQVPPSLDSDEREIELCRAQHRPRFRPSEPELLDDDEKVALLNGKNQTDKVSWYLLSPFWCLCSKILLKITYRPAWQAIPEFTQRQSCAGATFSNSCSCCQCNDQIDWFSKTYTTNDIIRVQKIPKFRLANVGDCQAVKVYLRQLNVDDVDDVPEYLQLAWERHLHRMKKEGAASNTNIGPILTFCLPDNETDAPLLWQVSFPVLPKPIAIETLTILDGSLHVPSRRQPPPTHIYINGYQSWSFAGSIVKGREQPQSALPTVLSGAFNYGGSSPPSATIGEDDEVKDAASFKYKSDFFTCLTADAKVPSWRTNFRERRFPYQQLDETGGPALVLGWLSQHEQFGVICADKNLTRYQMHASCHGQIIVAGTTHGICTDWAYAQLLSPHSYDEEPLAHYLHATAAFNQAHPLQNGSLLTGWCSWYHYYENISASALRENIAKLAAMRNKVPTNVAVVDDGYMTAWGDWDSLKPGKFPVDGAMGAVSQDIESYGMRPGLWLAPFTADKHSKIAKEHPDWIITNDTGLPANSANCGKFFYGLDATHPAVRGHAYDAIKRAVDKWNYNVLKLDFLYAACLAGNGKYDLSVSRAQAMHLAMKIVREAAGPDVYLIGCGCPLASAIGFVDGMRVSADTGPTWYPPLPMPWWDQGTLPCLRSMIRNSMSRAPLGHRWWHNDPDCLLLGESTRLTEEEVASAASIVAMTCGMMLLSDDLTKVSISRLRILTKIFPMTGVTGVVLDLHSTNDGLPSLLRLWCTDEHQLHDDFRESASLDSDGRDQNAEATFFARRASFRIDEALPPLNERRRSCIHVTNGLGTWTVVSISNWSEKAEVVHVPPPALLPPPIPLSSENFSDTFLANDESDLKVGQNGYHIFYFWSSRYTWLPNQLHPHGEKGPEQTVSKKLASHETEIIHVKPVLPDTPQYIGSDIHFTCGKEVKRFRCTDSSVTVHLETEYNRVGHVFIFVPRVNTQNVKVTVNGTNGRWVVVGNTPHVNENGSPRLVGRILRIMVVIHADGSESDGEVRVDF